MREKTTELYKTQDRRAVTLFGLGIYEKRAVVELGPLIVRFE